MAKQLITLNLNGERSEVAVEPAWTLLETVRDKLRLTGTKEGCGTGDCGACSMIVDGRLITSCLMLAVQADGRQVVTVEGISSNGDLDMVQRAFIDKGGVQCGYCTPGFIVAARALLDSNPSPTLEEVRAGLAGNLCRCTGYAKIYESVLAAADTWAAQRMSLRE